MKTGSESDAGAPARILETVQAGHKKQRTWYYLTIQGRPRRRISKTEHTRERDTYSYIRIGKGEDREIWHTFDGSYRLATKRAYVETMELSSKMNREFSETERYAVLKDITELKEQLSTFIQTLSNVEHRIKTAGVST